MIAHPDDEKKAGKYHQVLMPAPANSIKSKTSAEKEPAEKKEIAQIATGQVRRKSVFRRLGDNLKPQDMRSVGEDVFIDVILPSIRDMLFDAVLQTASRVILGEDARPMRHGGGRGLIQSIADSWVPYNRMSKPSSPMRASQPLQLERRKQPSFRDIVLESRAEAEMMIDGLGELIAQYDSASVHDLLQMIGIQGSFPDMDYGWTDITGSRVQRLSGGGYALLLPNTVPLR